MDLEEKFKRLNEIDKLVMRMRSLSVDELPESELIAMMKIAVRALETNPQPKELQEKLKRLGWGEWVPTPNVTDENKEFYITLGDRHVHIMSCEEALSLSDEELQQRIEQAIGMTFEEACEQYGVGVSDMEPYV